MPAPEAVTTLQRARATQLIALLKPAQPAPAAVLADVVSSSLFALVAALPEAENMLPTNPPPGTSVAEQRAALAWFRD